MPVVALLLLCACQKKEYDCNCFQLGKENEISNYKIRAGDHKGAVKDCQYQAKKLNTTTGAYMCKLID